MRRGVRPVHSPPLGDVPRVGGSPPCHAQLLHQLPHLLFRLRPLQKGTLQGDALHFVVVIVAQIRRKSRKTRL